MTGNRPHSQHLNHPGSAWAWFSFYYYFGGVHRAGLSVPTAGVS